MPVEVVPNRIEQSELLGGWVPDPLESAVMLDESPDALNVLPNAGSVEVRPGYTRLSAGRISSLAASHWIRHVNYYELIDDHSRKRYLMLVLTNGTDAAANNVQIWAYDLVANTVERVDTADRPWNRADTEHWYAIVEGTYYGGTLGEEIYSWHPTYGWNDDPTLPEADTWVNNTNPSAGEVARNFAFKKRDEVKYGTNFYKTTKSIRFDTWEDDQSYREGDKVSRWASEGGETYWRSFKCIDRHTSATADNAPGTGTDWEDFWQRVRLDNILDDEDEITEDWVQNPVPNRSAVGIYHGNRLFIRQSDEDNWARVQYSAPAKPEANAEISDLTFNPTAWDPVDNFTGGGGGWFNVPFSGKGDAIRAFYSFGNYLIIAGRWQSFVLVGTNEATWTLRKLGDYGAVGPQAIAEMDGIVYMIGRHGYLTRTDGTQIEPVPGMEKIQIWLKDKLDDVIGAQDENWYPNITGHDRKLWISLPVPDGADNCTLVYDPLSESFWKTDLPILDMTVGELGGTSRLFFSTAIDGDAGESPTVFQLKDNPGAEVYTDDDPQGGASTLTTDITWYWRSSWFQFGMARIERRVRRAWALVSGEASQSVIVKLYKSFVSGTEATTATRTLQGTGTREAEFVEGKVGQSGTVSYSTALRVGGTTNARTAVHGVGIDTERVRTRFKRS